MKRVRIILAVLIIGGVVAGAGYLGFVSSRSPNARPMTAPTTVAVSVCDVQQTVTAPSSLVNTQTVNLQMPVAGQLAEVLVRPGDAVSAGQVLARLANQEKFQADEAAAELELAQAQQALAAVRADAPLKAAQAQLTYVEAQQDLAKAQRALAALQSPDLTYYQRQVERAQDDLNIAQANAAQTDLASAVQRAQNALEDAAGQLNNLKALAKTYPGGFTDQVNQAQRNYDTAAEDLQNATLRYQVAQINNGNASEDAQANLAQAQRQLAEAQSGPNAAQAAMAQAQVAVKQAQLAQAQSMWNSLQSGPDPLELKAAQARVDQATAALAEARRTVDQTTIKAPIDGVVLESHAPTHETIAAATDVFTLAAPLALEVKANVTQDDYPLLRLGQNAVVYFDARPDLTVPGRVDRIIPELVAGASPTYDIIVALAQVPDGLVDGMTADTNITVASRSGVLCLPRSLVRASGNNQAVIQVWNGAAAENRNVTVGLRGDTNVEIVAGLAEGEQVVVR